MEGTADQEIPQGSLLWWEDGQYKLFKRKNYLRKNVCAALALNERVPESFIWK